MTVTGPVDDSTVKTPARGVPMVPEPRPSAEGTATAQATPAATASTVPATPGAPDLSFLKGPAITAAATYFAVVIVALIASLFLGGALKGALTDQLDVANTAGLSGRLPFLLAGMAMFGTLSGVVNADGGFISGQGTAALSVVPLGLTGVALIVSWLATTLQPGAQDVKGRWRDALSTGAVLAVIAALGAALTKWSWSGNVSGLAADASLQVDPLPMFFGALALGTVGAALGRATTGTGLDLTSLGIRVPSPVRHVLNSVTIPAVAFGVVVTTIGAVFAFIKVGFSETIGALMTVGPNLLAWVATFSGLGALSATTSETSDSSATNEVINMLSVGGWSWLLLAIPVLFIVTGAVRGYLAAGARPIREAWAGPSIFAALALIGLILTSASGSVSIGSAMYSDAVDLSVSIAWFSVLIAAAWGLAFELAQRHLAPYVLALWPGIASLNAKLPATVTNRAVLASVSTTPPTTAPTGSTPDGQEPSGPDGPVLTPVTIDRRKAIRVAIVLGVLLAGAATLVGARAVLANVMFSPSKPVEQYVAALEAGRVSDAFALADPDVPNAQRALLTDEVYSKVEARTSGGKVTKTEISDDTAYVTVVSDQDGAKATVRYTLRKDGKVWLVFDKWVLDRTDIPLVDVSGRVGYDNTEYTVNGVRLERGTGGQASFRALPGRYTVSLVDRPLFTHGDFTVLVGGDGVATVESEQVLSYELTDEARASSIAAAQKYATECLAALATLDDDDACGTSVYVNTWEREDVRDVKWALDGTPEFEVAASDDGSEVYVNVEGDATVTWTLGANPERWRDEDRAYEDDTWFSYRLTFPVKDGALGEPQSGW